VRYRSNIWLAIGALLAPLAFLIAVRIWTDDDLEGVTFDAEPLIVTPTQRQVRDQQRVKVVLEWKEGAVLRAPGWSGLVTAVYVEPGAEITQGQRIVAIDGVDRVAFARPSPFHRMLASGAKGADVSLLHDLLLTMGFIEALPTDPEFVSFATSLAVEEFNTSLGIASSNVFDPAVVIWMPFAPFLVATLNVELGAAAPGANSVIVTGTPALASGRLEAASPVEPIALDRGVPYVVLKGDTRLDFDPETLTVKVEEVSALADLVTPLADRTDALVERETPLRALAVPATAIVTNAAGNLCAWVVDAPNNGRTAYKAVPVTLAGSRSGVTDVLSGLGPTHQVLANPSDVLDDARCP